MSALGINNALDSEYAKSKLDGELNIQKNFPLATILRPSVVYSVDDNFTTSFMTLLSRLPFFHFIIMDQLNLLQYIVRI